MLDYFDAQNRLLLAGPSEEAERLCLWRREIGLAVLNAERKVYVRRVGAEGGLWELPARGFIRSGEDELTALERVGRTFSFADGAIQGEAERITLEERRIHLVLFAMQELVSAPLVLGSLDDGLFSLDRDELEGLARYAPELLTPELAWLAARSCWLWPKGHRINRK